MKAGIYSDVHANFVALKAVLEFFEKHDSLDWHACLGDVVGYGAAPDRCCDLVREHTRFGVLGNHDAAVCGRMNYSYYYPAARNALDHHRSRLKSENLEWLKELPYSVVHEEVCLTHGSPINEGSFEYIFTLEHAEALRHYWDKLEPITLLGHSHLTKSFRIPPPDSDKPVEELNGSVLDLSKSGKYVATVGSVGQPRDNDARACCTILDTDEKTLTFHRVDYDIYASAESIWDCEHLAPDFGKRLFLGV